ncbi:hypothetical protein [Hymenobacter bucti]|uniref:Uncharacterized protein n=1 Tax=Hymenobacter bucti TaxID=1844114 RepID=A0ABW4QS88_9BACT
MKSTGFIFAALLGLGLSTTAFAQTVPVTPGAAGAATPPIAPGTMAPGQTGTTIGTVPTGAANGTLNGTTNGTLTTPVGSTAPGTVYAPGTSTVPNATLDATRPMNSPATPGAMRRTTTGGRTNTTKTVRP